MASADFSRLGDGLAAAVVGSADRREISPGKNANFHLTPAWCTIQP